MKAGLEVRRNPKDGETIPGVVSSPIEWVGIGLLMVLFATVLAGVWMVLVQGVPFPLETICLRG